MVKSKIDRVFSLSQVTFGGVLKKIVVVLTILLLLLTACSGGTTPEEEENKPTLAPTGTSAQTPTPTLEPTVTLTTTPTPTKVSTPTRTSTSSPTITVTRTPTNTITSTATLQLIINGDCIPLNTKREIGMVKSITDGDTIVVEIEGVDYFVRYIGIDAPEPPDGELGISSSNANTDLVLGKEVTLIRDVTDVDPFDRLPRYVLVESTFVNEYLVRIGMASASSYSPDASCDDMLREAQGEAEYNQSGMWSPIYFDPGSREVSPTSVSLCNCSVDYDCSDFSTHLAAQACFGSCGGSKSNNWSGLDRDRNGIACESLP